MRCFVAILGLLAGCTQVPFADELPVADERAAAPGYAFVPDRAAVPESAPDLVEPEPDAESIDDEAPEPAASARPYSGPPKIVVTRYDAARITDAEYGMADGTARCPFAVVARGFPAISEDGRTIAYHVADVLSSSDGEDEIVTVQHVDVESDTVAMRTVIVDGEQFDGRYHCWKLWRQARARAAEVNADLATGWRPMTELALAGSEDGDSDDFEDGDTEGDSPPPRSVDFVWMRKQAIVRIPHVEVLARIDADWKVPDERDGCWFSDPWLTETWIDRETGISAVRVEQVGGPCYCYAETLYHPIRFSPDVLARIDRSLP